MASSNSEVQRTEALEQLSAHLVRKLRQSRRLSVKCMLFGKLASDMHCYEET